ncbi:MAG: hypothetical protein ACMVY4_10710 [Minwuia sp.]|uniref:hypothetical protein n=1 Tax=Minwuia sp. TaxID=2493630 RepID=UPI003A8624DF
MSYAISKGAVHMAAAAVVAGNAVAGPVTQAGLFAVDPVVWLALALGMWRLWREGRDVPPAPSDLVLAVAVAAACLLPSARIAWIAGAAAFGWLAATEWRRNGVVPAGMAVLLAVSLREPVTWLLTTLFAESLLRADALLAGWLASLFLPVEAVRANIIVTGNGHSLFVMTGCSSVNNLSMALLFWFAVTRGMGVRAGAGHAIFLGSLIVALNVVRLAAMSVSPASYAWLHDGGGATAISLFTAVLTAAVTWTSLETPHARPQPA